MRYHLPLCFILFCSSLRLFSCISCTRCIRCVRFVLLKNRFGGVERKVPDIKILWPINFLIITGSARDIKNILAVPPCKIYLDKMTSKNSSKTYKGLK